MSEIPAARPAAPTAVGTAVVLATARAADGRPAALLPWGDGTVLGRLAGQLGPAAIVVVARREFEADVRRAAGPAADVHASVSPADDLRAIAAAARSAGGELLVLHGDVVTHAEALAWLRAAPGTGALAGSPARAEFPVQARGGRLTSAASAYHGVGRPNATFLGVLRAAPADLGRLADVADRLAALVADPPDAWRAELARKAARPPDDTFDGDDYPAPEGTEGGSPGPADADDVAALLLVGLVRAGVPVAPVFLRRLLWERSPSPATFDRFARADVDRLLLDSSVKGSDGFFTTFFVSPYSKHVARWAARHGLTPDQVTIASMAIGVLAAAAFSTGERWGLVAGAVLLLASFVTDCVDGQLARYTRSFSRLGGWLDAMFDRAKEYLAYAGLAIGAGDVWLLACAAITLQTVRHAADFSFLAAQEPVRQPPLEEPLDEPARPARILAAWRGFDTWAPLRWGKRMVAFPIGERFAVIAITAALLEPRVTFVVLLAWGGVALVYSQTGRVLRSLR